jgi:hypothetical protein
MGCRAIDDDAYDNNYNNDIMIIQNHEWKYIAVSKCRIY